MIHAEQFQQVLSDTELLPAYFKKGAAFMKSKGEVEPIKIRIIRLQTIYKIFTEVITSMIDIRINKYTHHTSIRTELF